MHNKLEPEILIGKRYVAAVYRHGDQMIAAAERTLDDVGPIEFPKVKVASEEKPTIMTKIITEVLEFISRLRKACKAFVDVLRKN